MASLCRTCLSINQITFNNKEQPHQIAIGVRRYSTLNNSKDYPCIKVYPDMEADKLLLLGDNKCGIYLLTNKLTKKTYIGVALKILKLFKSWLYKAY